MLCVLRMDKNCPFFLFYPISGLNLLFGPRNCSVLYESCANDFTRSCVQNKDTKLFSVYLINLMHVPEQLVYLKVSCIYKRNTVSLSEPVCRPKRPVCVLFLYSAKNLTCAFLGPVHRLQRSSKA